MKKFCFILVLLSLFLASCVLLQDATISTTGTAQFADESIDVLVILVNDLKAAINNWNSVPENKAPITKSTRTVSLENNSIALLLSMQFATKVAIRFIMIANW